MFCFGPLFGSYERDRQSISCFSQTQRFICFINSTKSSIRHISCPKFKTALHMSLLFRFSKFTHHARMAQKHHSFSWILLWRFVRLKCTWDTQMHPARECKKLKIATICTLCQSFLFCSAKLENVWFHVSIRSSRNFACPALGFSLSQKLRDECHVSCHSG